MSSIKLIVEDSIESARLNMEPDYSMRSSTTGVVNNQNFNFGVSSNVNESVFFEEVKQNTPSALTERIQTTSTK
jgi:hypothetical protein